MFVLFFAPLAACGTAQFHDFDGSLSGVVGLGTSWSMRTDVPAPIYDPADFQPASRSMSISTRHDTPLELNFSAEFRLRMAPWFYTGITSEYLSINGEGSETCPFYNCHTIRSSVLNWWDTVPLEDVIIKRSPSFGLIVGFMTYSHKIKTLIQYDLSVRHYEIIVDNYSGKDCVGCLNTSYVKDTISIARGAAWRHTVTVGCEVIRLAFWLELDGSRQLSAGLNVILLNALFIEKEDMKEE
jgi:hypothetical protein